MHSTSELHIASAASLGHRIPKRLKTHTVVTLAAKHAMNSQSIAQRRSPSSNPNPSKLRLAEYCGSWYSVIDTEAPIFLGPSKPSGPSSYCVGRPSGGLNCKETAAKERVDCISLC
ncbi:hypothetical protein CSOJ01_11752 [Colletotrichum sojae]|uniref:Uncharacterized protein n=1 Tax=Colletotrichum sojae TaxID=2175907 RepID=A0A8H6IXE5_9PEZI|nr:hypothetical protein CSOJ01_11752 [Colletotrichum sojae]